jgi:hypothetical protein
VRAGNLGDGGGEYRGGGWGIGRRRLEGKPDAAAAEEQAAGRLLLLERKPPGGSWYKPISPSIPQTKKASKIDTAR